MLVLLDFENLVKSFEGMPPPNEFAVTAGFDRLIKEIAQEVGEVIDTFVFLPMHLAYSFGETFYNTGFFTIACPKVRGKQMEEVDTTDETLINFGRSAIENIKDLTHLCIGSGDKDFTPLVRHAIKKRLKIIVITSSEKSLSAELKRLADKVYMLSLDAEHSKNKQRA